jgi:hypothetical protein
VIYDVHGQVRQQGAEEGEVRNYPVREKGACGLSSLWVGKWWHGGVKTVRVAAVRRPDGDTRPRREWEGCACMAGEGEKWAGEEKGAQQ